MSAADPISASDPVSADPITADPITADQISAPDPIAGDPITTPGTDEAEWQAWGLADRLPVLPTPDGPVVVAVAHPDDETLTLGGVLARLAACGTPLTLVVATDGEGSHPESTAITPERLRILRTEEQHEALRRLGLAPHAPGDAPHRDTGHAVEVVRWHLPDSGLRDEGDRLTDRLVPLLGDAATVLTMWSGDAHPDHGAIADAAAGAGAHVGIPVWQAPLWAWHWAVPGDPRLPWDRAGRLPLSDLELARKRHAVDAYASQLRPLGPRAEDGPVVPPGTLAHLTRPFEVVLT